MTDESSRRSFVKQTLYTAALAPLAGPLSRMSALAPPVAPDSPRRFMEPFDYNGVRLLDSRFKSQYDTMRDYYFNINDDSALKGFRVRAGLRGLGEDLGGWYSGDPNRRTWWSMGDTFNTFGQWLSGMARMSRATNDDAMRRKAGFLMSEWGKTIDPDGFFFYSKRPWQPHYIYEKTVCGLVDMAKYAGRTDALPMLEKITDWAIANLDRARKVDSNTEWYTLSENLYRAYELTGNTKYRDFGDVWRFTDYWKSFTGPSPVLRYGHHAYSHVNTLSSAAMTYSVTGDTEYLRTITNAYDWLQQTQCFATGGYGPDEDIVAPDGELGKRLETTWSSFETPCGTWAAFKLARYLMIFTGESRYGDWMERLLYNGIGAALPMGPNGQTFYYSDYRLGGGRKIYHLDGTWPCCSGTYPQVVADYHNIIYYHDPAGLYVNLFVPSSVTWNHDGKEITVEQLTSFPETDTTTLTVRPARALAFDLRVRVPLWTRGATFTVNGSALDVAAVPGSWATIRRTWNPGDRLTIRLPMQLTLVPVDTQHPNRVAVTYGPVVLVRHESPALTPGSGDLRNWITGGGNSLEFTAAGQPHGSLVPFYKVDAGTPYNMYFDIRT
jgi:hypothetical protein